MQNPLALHPTIIDCLLANILRSVSDKASIGKWERLIMFGAIIALSGFWFGFFTGQPVVCGMALFAVYFAVFGSVDYEKH